MNIPVHARLSETVRVSLAKAFVHCKKNGRGTSSPYGMDYSPWGVGFSLLPYQYFCRNKVASAKQSEIVYLRENKMLLQLFNKEGQSLFINLIKTPCDRAVDI